MSLRSPSPLFPQDKARGYDPALQEDMERLYQLTVYGRWLVVGVSWLTIGLWSLWGLRQELSLWLDYFTWAAVRYGLAYNFLPTVGLAFCLGLTLAVLMWQSRTLLFGLPQPQQQRLAQQVQRIRSQGISHPLWQWISRKE